MKRGRYVAGAVGLATAVVAGAVVYSRVEREEIGERLHRECTSITNKIESLDYQKWSSDKWNQFMLACVVKRSGLGDSR